MSPHRLCLAALLVLLGVPALAQSKSDSRPIGTYGNWKAYKFNDKDQPVCYMTMSKKFPAGKKLRRNEAFLMITHRPAENSKDVVSYVAGYMFKPLSSVTVDIGNKSFDLFTQKDTAWSRDAATDHALAAAIRDGANIKIAGTPEARGADPVTDILNLKGSAAAYQAIGKACGYPVEAPVKPKKAAPAKPGKKNTKHP
ncbi:MAG: invasion associated locus B family protein [Bdellovibrionales bacterium]